MGIVKGQTHRAHYFCDLKENLLEELSFLRDVFVMNGYPLRLMNEVINNSWAKETKKSILRDSPTHAIEESKDQNTMMPSMHHITKILQRIYKRNYAISTLE